MHLSTRPIQFRSTTLTGCVGLAVALWDMLTFVALETSKTATPSPSVCLSVTMEYSAKTTKAIVRDADGMETRVVE